VSRAQLDEHRRRWSEKPVLERVYATWFELLLEQAPLDARVLEIGAGPGFLSQYARRKRPDLRWTASDLIPAPWNDVAADAHALPFRSESLDVILGLDVIHHIAQPRKLFEEAARVLRAGGRLAVVEPWVTPLSYPIYRFLHQEGCRLDLDPWAPFAGRGTGTKEAFEGDASVVWRLCRTAAAQEWQALGLTPPRTRLLTSFAYLLSLGFRPGSLLPAPLVAPLLALDRATRPAARLLGLRGAVCWERSSS
jgi:SAM-dependent methyltransferase